MIEPCQLMGKQLSEASVWAQRYGRLRRSVFVREELRERRDVTGREVIEAPPATSFDALVTPPWSMIRSKPGGSTTATLGSENRLK